MNISSNIYIIHGNSTSTKERLRNPGRRGKIKLNFYISTTFRNVRDVKG